MDKAEQRHRDFSIELDCPPGYPRPGDLIEGVIKGTGLDLKDFDTHPPLFGLQTWILKDDIGKDEKYLAAKIVLRERVSELFNAGYIRYGSW